MIKYLFLDYREVETLRGFTRKPEQPAKHPENPLFAADAPWENGNMQLYGSVLKAPGRPFQMWYSVIHPPWKLYLAYAESDDGISWRRPALDIFPWEGEKTNIILANDPHGPAVIYDADDPRDDWRYKMVAGASPSGCVCAYHSADGIRWAPVRWGPAMTTDPDCPMGFLRAPDGRYVVYHRLHGFGRRVFRSESWDFRFWSGEPRMVLEPDAGDPTQVQFYGMGSAAYGPYEIGTLWIYHTEPDELGLGKMRGYQDAELTYARHGTAWHRAAQGTPFLEHGAAGSWEQGNLQCASAPVFLEDEIRYYYMGTTMRHCTHWELEPQRAGLGMARLKPDRFVGLHAGAEPAELLTVPCRLPSPEVRVNASVTEGGSLRVAMLDADGRLIEGLGADDCRPIAGDSTGHAVRWPAGRPGDWVGKPVRFRLQAAHAALYSISFLEPGETPVYHRFAAVRP